MSNLAGRHPPSPPAVHSAVAAAVARGHITVSRVLPRACAFRIHIIWSKVIQEDFCICMKAFLVAKDSAEEAVEAMK